MLMRVMHSVEKGSRYLNDHLDEVVQMKMVYRGTTSSLGGETLY